MENKHITDEPIQLKKINNHLYEIPRTGKMNVPVLVYADEKLLEIMKKDKTLFQGRNMAHLPGIKKAFIMPDGHQGYGFPIGGVAAIDVNEGGISPGGIGYDINCLCGDSNILMEFGYTRAIADIENEFIDVENQNSEYILKSRLVKNSVVSYDFEEKRFSPNIVNYFMKRQHSDKIFNIKTKLGYFIKVTKEHPLLTKSGMVAAGKLVKGQPLAVYPFEGIDYYEPESFHIVDEIFFSIGERKELEKRGLFPLTLDNPKVPILTRLFGYLLGDGSIYFGKDGNGFISAFGQKEDLEIIKEDFEKLGFSARIYSRIRNHTIKDQYGTKEFTAENHELHVSSRSLARLFYALGYPKGIKTITPYIVPFWIMKSPKWLKRLFLSGLFGAEL